MQLLLILDVLVVDVGALADPPWLLPARGLALQLIMSVGLGGKGDLFGCLNLPVARCLDSAVARRSCIALLRMFRLSLSGLLQLGAQQSLPRASSRGARDGARARNDLTSGRRAGDWIPEGAEEARTAERGCVRGDGGV